MGAFFHIFGLLLQFFTAFLEVFLVLFFLFLFSSQSFLLPFSFLRTKVISVYKLAIWMGIIFLFLCLLRLLQILSIVIRFSRLLNLLLHRLQRYRFLILPMRWLWNLIFSSCFLALLLWRTLIIGVKVLPIRKRIICLDFCLSNSLHLQWWDVICIRVEMLSVVVWGIFARGWLGWFVFLRAWIIWINMGSICIRIIFINSCLLLLTNLLRHININHLRSILFFLLLYHLYI